MVNFPLILLNADSKVQSLCLSKGCIVLVLGKDTTKHCNASPTDGKCMSCRKFQLAVMDWDVFRFGEGKCGQVGIRKLK